MEKVKYTDKIKVYNNPPPSKNKEILDLICESSARVAVHLEFMFAGKEEIIKNEFYSPAYGNGSFIWVKDGQFKKFMYVTDFGPRIGLYEVKYEVVRCDTYFKHIGYFNSKKIAIKVAEEWDNTLNEAELSGAIGVEPKKCSIHSSEIDHISEFEKEPFLVKKCGKRMRVIKN